MTRRSTLSVSAVFIAFSAFATNANAQCPDGTPPPCSRTTSAVAPVRRANPALNTRSWIVVPFANVMKAADLDWLRDASVNLLSLDLGRWTDISVVDDKRVADLVRELPNAKSSEALSLNDGLAMARRVGAGMLVMGDYFKIGKGARLVANVFDVKTGVKLRTITGQAVDADSLLTIFSPLARGVLAVPPPTDAKLGSLGTTRTDAYQAYLLGNKALNRFNLPEAEKQLKLALVIDSMFALAHFKLSLAMGWGEIARDTASERARKATERAHAVAAARLSIGLPARERALIAGRLAEENTDYGRACDAYGALVAKDSSDVEALYGMGECTYHDDTVLPSANDSTVGRFRSSWNTSLRSMQKVLQLDPGFHLAFNHILDILSATQRIGCARNIATGACFGYSSIVLRDADSLLTSAYNRNLNNAANQLQYDRAGRERPYVVNLNEAIRLAREWVESNPTEERAHYYLAESNLALGKVQVAYDESRLTSGRDPSMQTRRLMQRFETAFKLGKGVEARALLDSLTPLAIDTTKLLDLPSLQAAFGDLTGFRSVRVRAAAAGSPSIGNQWHSIPFAMLGIPLDSINIFEKARVDDGASATCNDKCQRGFIFHTLVYAPRAPRTWWPVYPDGPLADERMVVARALSRKNMVDLRAQTLHMDTLARDQLKRGYSETGFSAIAAEGYLALGDSVSAFNIVKVFVDSVMPIMAYHLNMTASPTSTAFAPMLWVRMMLLRADLAAALKRPDEARIWYARVLELWTSADPELQPTVTRIRAALNTGVPTRP